MKTAIVIWIVVVLVGFGGVFWISREIDRRIEKTNSEALYGFEIDHSKDLDLVAIYGSEALEWQRVVVNTGQQLRVTNYSGADFDTFNPQEAGRNEL